MRIRIGRPLLFKVKLPTSEGGDKYRHEKPRTFRRTILSLCALYFVLVYAITAIVPAPRAVSLPFAPQSVENVTLLADISSIDEASQRKLEQQIFDEALDMIENATSLIVLDMFLFNDWQGPVKETHRELAGELSAALIRKKQAMPSIVVTVISDPVNNVYEGLPSPHFGAMRESDINVIMTDLTKLQDSNPLYSGFWRALIEPFDNERAEVLPNPFGPGKVSIRSYLALLNFKANHRKLLVADDVNGDFYALVSSANPHDGSSAHRNVALKFAGPAVFDVLASEWALLTSLSKEPSGRAHRTWLNWPDAVLKKLASHAVLKRRVPHSVLNEDCVNSESLSSHPVLKEDCDASDEVDPESDLDPASNIGGPMPAAATLQVVSESRIKQAALFMLDSALAGDKVNLLMFYLSDRDIVASLKEAQGRGVEIKVLLDVNQDAFGRKKRGIPNRPVAAELVEAGVDVRWCETAGEQCHAKLLYRSTPAGEELLLGSGNYTRRNMDDFNLETNVWLRSPEPLEALTQAAAHFEQQWSNQDGRTYSTEYEEYADESLVLKWRYRFMEYTGFGTF